MPQNAGVSNFVELNDLTTYHTSSHLLACLPVSYLRVIIYHCCLYNLFVIGFVYIIPHSNFVYCNAISITTATAAHSPDALPLTLGLVPAQREKNYIYIYTIIMYKPTQIT